MPRNTTMIIYVTTIANEFDKTHTERALGAHCRTPCTQHIIPYLYQGMTQSAIIAHSIMLGERHIEVEHHMLMPAIENLTIKQENTR